MNRPIHIIDDDALWRAIVAEMIQALPGFVAVEWESGNAFHDSPDKAPGIALIDVKMPGMSGDELLVLLDQARFLPIMMSGSADIALAVEAVKRGAFDFLEKPCSAQKLEDTIAKASREFEQRYHEALRREEDLARFEALSHREREILAEIAGDSSNREAGEKFGISVRTVEAHRARIMLKLGMSSFAEVVSLAHGCGFAAERRKRSDVSARGAV